MLNLRQLGATADLSTRSEYQRSSQFSAPRFAVGNIGEQLVYDQEDILDIEETSENMYRDELSLQ